LQLRLDVMVQQFKETHSDQEQKEAFKPLEQSECQQAFVMAPLVFVIPLHVQLLREITS